MANIKLSKSQKVTIAGVTFFSAIILGGLNTTNVSAAIENPTADQAVEQTNTGTTSSGTDPKITSADTGSDNGVNTSGQIDSNIYTGSTVSGSDSGAGAAGTDGNLEATNSGSNTGNNQLSSNNVSSYSATPVATAATEVPVADSQGNTIDWNNKVNYNQSGYATTSGVIINYSVDEPDGNGAGNYNFLPRGQTIIVGNPGDKVDLTGVLPQGYSLDDSDADQLIQTIGSAQGDSETNEAYIQRITKNLLVKVNPEFTGEGEGSLGELKNIIDLYDQNKVLIATNAYPSLYFEFKYSLVSGGKTISAFSPVGFQFIIANNIQNFTSFSGSGTANPNKMMLKDNKTKMPNLVNFKLGDTTISSTTTDATKLGDSVEVIAPEGYTFADGSNTKSVTIGAASPMYMAYYATLGITDIDPSIHDLEIVKSPEIKSDETVNLNVADTTWSPESAYDAVNSTDTSGVAIPYAKLSVTIKKVGSDTPETSSTIDQTKPGKYVVTYSYNGVSSTTNVSVTQTPTISSATSYDVLNDSATSWKKAVESAYLNGIDENGDSIGYNDLTVTIDGSPASEFEQTVGDHKIVYSYSYGDNQRATSETTLHIKQNPTIAINIHNSTIHVGDSWNPEDNLDSATDADGKAVELDGLTITNNVDTTKAGTYTATYSLNNVSEVATITVLPKSTTNPGTPSNDKEWLINAPYLVKADGYTQIYSSPSTTTPVATRQLAHDTDWMVGLAVQNSEGTFYQVSTSEWVKAEDMWAFEPIADVVYSNDPDNTEVFSTVDSSKTTDINLSYQTAWLVDRIAVDNDGNTWYRVGTSNYVKKSDVTKTAPDTTSNGIVQLTGTGNIPLYNLDYYGNIKRASRSVSSGTNWISNNHREFKGTTYHQISNAEWVSELDSVFKKQ